MRTLVIATALTLVGGCARMQVEPPSVAAEHASAVAALDAWVLAGRIGVQRDDQGFSGALDWRQSGDAYRLRVMAPLNGGAFALAGGADAVELVTPRGERHVAADAESLMRAHLGWSIALAGARYWIRGIPRPGAAASQEIKDAAGRWTDFAQDGWRISILDYMDVEGLSLPRRLFLARDGLEVRIAVTRWEHP